MNDDFLKEWSNVIQESDRCVRCNHCGGDVERDEVMWFHIPGRPGRVPFCSHECRKSFIYSEMEYHKDMLAELEMVYGEL